MFVGTVLTSHRSLTPTQAAIYSVHDGHLIETLRDVSPGVIIPFVNLAEPAFDCIPYPPTVLWADDPPPTPLRVFMITSSGQLAARLLNPLTRLPLSWELHGLSPTVFTPPGASVTWPPAVRLRYFGLFWQMKREGTLSLVLDGVASAVFALGLSTRRSVFVGATDGSLWERTRVSGRFAWISHGSPPGTCVVGEPMTDPALVPPASPLRIFAAAASGALVERIIDGPGGVTWVDHGRPTGAAGPLNVASGGVIVADLAGGAVHALVMAGEFLHRLSIPALGMPGTWTTLPAPPPPTPLDATWVSSSPSAATIIVRPGTLFASFFVVGSRRRVTPGVAGRTLDEVWHCGHDFRSGGMSWLTNLGGPGRPPLAGTNEFLVSEVRGHAPELGRVYASSRPSQGGTESLDEWSYDVIPTSSTALGLPSTMPAPCTNSPTRMTGCGGPRTFGVGSAG